MQLTRKLPPHLRGDLQAEQFRILRTQIPTLYVVLLINTGILSFSVYGSMPIALSLGVPALFCVVMVVRMAIWLARKQTPPSESRIARYLLSTTLVAAIVSLGLGVWGVALLQADVHDKPFVPMFIAFGAIACTYCLGSLPRAAFATVFLAVTPVTIALLTSGGRMELAAAVSMLLIFPLILRLVVHQHANLIYNVISRSHIKALAFTDPLTDLPNRRAFTEHLQINIEKGTENGMTMALALIDLDGFKAINDTLGHGTGDAVLIQAAERLREAGAECQMVARLGGDEFAVLMLVDGDREPLTRIATKLIQEMNRPFAVSGSQLHLSASIGLATYLEGDTSTLAVMSRADMALYEVKHDGGNGMLWSVPAMATRLRRRLIIEQSLRDKDSPAHIEVVYQPIFDAKSGQVASFEALARWNHPKLGAIPPLEFVGIAEQTGTSGVLSELIFDAAIREAARWPSTIGLAINLCGVDLCRPSTTLMILSICQRHGFDTHRLEVEVTETSLLADYNIARDQLKVLRQSGIKVALDDFGSGFASISYLKQIKFDRVKIDGDLITNIMESRDARRLVQGILQLCSAIDVPVTAEKVESEHQRAFLVGLGCDRLQGYYLGLPMDPSSAQHCIDVRRNAA